MCRHHKKRRSSLLSMLLIMLFFLSSAAYGATFTVTPESTARGNSFWDKAILKLDVSISGSIATFTLSKNAEPFSFQETGDVYLQIGTPASGSEYIAKAFTGGVGLMEIPFTVDLGDTDKHPADSFPKNFYVRCENDKRDENGNRTWSWVGPIKIERDDDVSLPDDPRFNWSKPSENADVTGEFQVSGRAYDNDMIKRIDIRLKDENSKSVTIRAYEASTPTALNKWISKNINPDEFDMASGDLWISIWMIDGNGDNGADNCRCAVAERVINWQSANFDSGPGTVQDDRTLFTCVGWDGENTVPSVSGVQKPEVTVVSGVSGVDEGEDIDFGANTFVDTSKGGEVHLLWCADKGKFVFEEGGDYQTVTYVAPLVSGDEEVTITVKVFDGLGYVSNDQFILTVRDAGQSPGEDEAEIPAAPKLYTIGSEISRNSVPLSWQKVVDSRYHDNADYYEVEYADNRYFNGSALVEAPNTAAGNNIYESVSYTVEGLQDNKTYYFRVRAVNSAGTGRWSNRESIRINVPDFPVFEDFQVPADGAKNVSKTPLLKWRATDADGNDLDYRVNIGEDPDNLYVRRSFKDSEHQGESSFDYATEYREPLKPGTKYYWQIWVRENGYYADRYNGEYIKSPVWSFTTLASGSDLAIVNVQPPAVIKPDTDATFKITVKNQGQEPADRQVFVADYIKSGSESPFRWVSGSTTDQLAPGDSETIDVTVKFREDLIESNGKTYDNILVAGPSQIRFGFMYDDEQDVNADNNVWLYDVDYENQGPPEITYLEIRENGLMYNDSVDFWARAGKTLGVILSAEDDLLIKSLKIEYRLDSTDAWHPFFDEELNVQSFSGQRYDWNIPQDIAATDDAQIRITLIDDGGEKTEKFSEVFSIYADSLDATITPNADSFKVGEKLSYTITVPQSSAPVRHLRVSLEGGALMRNILDDWSDTDAGMEPEPSYEWDIPNQNQYALQNCVLELIISDVYGNEKTVRSNSFTITADTELPAPFNTSVDIYDEAFDFPTNASYPNEMRAVKFVKLDDDNIAHAVLLHQYSYYIDTNPRDASDYTEDFHESVRDFYYITHDQENDLTSSKIKICDINYEVQDFEMIDGIPYALLEKMDGKNQYFVTHKSGNSFTSPALLLNQTVPNLRSASASRIANVSGSYYMYMSERDEYVFCNGYLWNLNILSNNKIGRWTFSNGEIGETRDIVQLQGTANGLESAWVEPVVDGNIIYFIDPGNSKLVKLNTSNNSAAAYSLNGLSIGGRDEGSKRVAMVAKSGNVYIFADGRVYTLQGSSIVERSAISYTFGSDTVSYAASFDWSDILLAKAVIADGKIYLILNGSIRSITKPVSSAWELLEFNPSTFGFTKRVMDINDERENEYLDYKASIGGSDNMYMKSDSDILYYGNNKVIFSVTNDHYMSSIHNYRAYIHMLDLETGDIVHLGDIEAAKGTDVSLVKDNSGNVFALIENKGVPYSTDVFRLTFENMNARPDFISRIQLLKHNGSLYAAWRYGTDFDARWDSVSEKLVYKAERKNWFAGIYPSLTTKKTFSDTYLGNRHLNVTGNYLTAPSYGRIYSLNSDFTVNGQIHENGNADTILLDSFGAGIVGGYSKYDNGSYRISLFDEALAETKVTVDSSDNDVAAFENEIIIVGNQSSKNLVTKVNPTTGSTIYSESFGNADSEYNYRKTDVNQNQYVAVGWSHYIAVGDLSESVVPPDIQFSIEDGDVVEGKPLTLKWKSTEPQENLTRFEIYKSVNGQETLLITLTDVETVEYTVDITEAPGVEISFKIVAYNQDETPGFDKRRFKVIPNLALPPGGKGNIEGCDFVCAGTDCYTQSYKVSGFTDATSYEWSVDPQGAAQIIAGQGTDTVELKFTDESETGVELRVTPQNEHGSGIPASFDITLDTEGVWPGDVDYNGVVNDPNSGITLNDFNIFSVLAKNCLPPPSKQPEDLERQNCPSLGISNYEWACHPAKNWPDILSCPPAYSVWADQLNGKNLKHLDCNGDGKIDVNYDEYYDVNDPPKADLEVIQYNIAHADPPTHTGNRRSKVITTNSAIHIFPISDQTTSNGREMVFEVVLGSEGNEAEITGINFELRLSEGAWENAEVLYFDENFTAFHLGMPPFDMFTMDFTHPKDKTILMIAMQRKDFNQRVFAGETLCRVSCTVSEDAVVSNRRSTRNSTSQISFNNVNLFSAEGEISSAQGESYQLPLGQSVEDPDTDGDSLSDEREIEIGTDPNKADTDGDGINDGAEVEAGTDPLDTDNPGSDDPELTTGVFIVDEDGEVRIDYLFDGGLYQGEMGIFSLSGMEDMEPGSPEFVAEAIRRVLSESELGHVAIRDASEGARFSGQLGSRQEADFNVDKNKYKGVKTFAMTPGDKLVAVLIPDSTFAEVAENPGTTDAKKRPLFSLATGNPDDGMFYGQVAGVSPEGCEFANAIAFEDISAENSDRDYNDLVFRIRGVTVHSPTLDGLIAEGEMDPDDDWRITEENGVTDHLCVPQPDENTPWITVTLKSPADLLVYDPEGRVIGKDGGQIPGATFEWDENGHQVVTLPALEDGDYNIVLRAIGDGGLCHLEITGYQVGGEIVSQEKPLTIEPHQVLKTVLPVSDFTENGEIVFDTPSVPTAPDGTPLAFDFDGDGDIDDDDIQRISDMWGSEKGDPEYDAFYDLDEDGRIGLFDIMSVANSYHTP